MPAPWSQRLLCNEGLVQGHCLALMRDAAPLGNGTECFFSLRVSNLKAACPLCTLPCAPPAVLGLLGPQHPWSGCCSLQVTWPPPHCSRNGDI